MRSIYLDYNASTPVDEAVAAVMTSLIKESFGNPSSTHWASTGIKQTLEQARGEVAALLQCHSGEVIFTSGGSEANNFALKGVFFAHGGKPFHVVTTQIEHPAITSPCAFLERLGARITYLPVDSTGLVDPDDVRRAISRDTGLISVMHANNEVGTIQPIAEIAKIARSFGIPMHADAAQSVGKIGTEVDELDVDLLSVAGHKLYAPKGIGALYVRRGIDIEPLLHGAGHESGRRAGTESVLLAAALGRACAIAREWVGKPEAANLKAAFWERLKVNFGDQVVLNGHPTLSLPNTLNVSFVGHIGAEILSRLPTVAASTGSACHSGQVTLSPVLRAMKVPPEVGKGAIRFSLGRTTTLDEIEEVVGLLVLALS